MKQILSFVLIIGLSSVLADPPLYSNPIDYYNVLNGYSSFSGYDRWVCDDFVLEDDCYINEIYIWILFTGGMTNTINFQILADDFSDSDPNTCYIVWAESIPCVLMLEVPWNTGPEYFTVHCAIDTNNRPQLTGGTHYYIATQVQINDNCFVLVSHNYIDDYCWLDDGSGVYIRSDIAYGEDSDMYLILEGEPVSALESETWGSIKTLF